MAHPTTYTFNPADKTASICQRSGTPVTSTQSSIHVVLGTVFKVTSNWPIQSFWSDDVVENLYVLRPMVLAHSVIPGRHCNHILLLLGPLKVLQKSELLLLLLLLLLLGLGLRFHGIDYWKKNPTFLQFVTSLKTFCTWLLICQVDFLLLFSLSTFFPDFLLDILLGNPFPLLLPLKSCCFFVCCFIENKSDFDFFLEHLADV